MPKTIKDMTKGQIPGTVDALENLRDKIAKWGAWDKIKAKASPALFLVDISGEMIEAWQEGGWRNIIERDFDMLPYIPDALDELGLHEIKTAFQRIQSLFPELTEFDDEDADDVMTFLSNHRLEVFDDRLKRYGREKRIEISKEFREILESLDDLSERVWGYQTPQGGWESLLRYVERRYNNE